LAAELRSYLQVWADTFANIVADLSGTSTTCEVLQDLTTEKPELENSLFAHGTISGAIAGAFSFRIPQATVGELMRTKEEVAGKEARDPAGVLKEIFERAAGQVSSHLGLSHAVQDVSNQAPTDLEAAQSYWFRLDTTPACLLELQMDSGCAAALQSRPLGKDADETPIAGEARSPEENLEVLKHVELAVSIRFGGRRMLLKDILDLSAGSIVELDQQIQQPVDLLLDGRLIARGEVVVVEGNYGLRVTEVLANVVN